MKFAYDWKNTAIQQMSLAALLGVFVGVACLLVPPLYVLIGVGALFGAWIVYRLPEAGLLVIAFFLSSITAEAAMPLVDFGPVRFYLTDLVTIWLFVILAVRALVDRQFILQFNRVTIPLMLFFVWAVSATVIRLLQETTTFAYAIHEVRIILYYMLFFVTLNLIKDKAQLNRLLGGLFALATITALANILQYVLGADVALISGRVEPFSPENPQMAYVTRITDNPGEGLITISFIVLTIKLFLSSFKFSNILQLVQWAIIGGALLISFNRTHWGVALGSIIITFFLIHAEQKKKLLTWTLYLLWIIPLLLLPAIVAPQTEAGQLVSAAITRGVSMFAPESYVSPVDSTILWRNFEYQYGIPRLLDQPVFGLGLGAYYRPLIVGVDHARFTGQHYTHNGHFWIMMKTGFPGWLFFISAMITFVVQGLKNWRQVNDVRMQSIFLGFTLVGLAVFFASILHPIYMTIFWTPLLGISLGLNDVILKLYQKPDELLSATASAVS